MSSEQRMRRQLEYQRILSVLFNDRHGYNNVSEQLAIEQSSLHDERRQRLRRGLFVPSRGRLHGHHGRLLSSGSGLYRRLSPELYLWLEQSTADMPSRFGGLPVGIDMHDDEHSCSDDLLPDGNNDDTADAMCR